MRFRALVIGVAALAAGCSPPAQNTDASVAGLIDRVGAAELSRSAPPEVVVKLLDPELGSSRELSGELVSTLASGTHLLFVIIAVASAAAFVAACRALRYWAREA